MREPGDYSSALQNFRRARRQADLERIVTFLKEQEVDILSHDELYTQLQTLRSLPHQPRKIPLDAIIGKLSRDKEFSENFFGPPDRNARALLATATFPNEAPERLDPIEVYQIGESYVVYDGSSRLSMALQAGASVIEAFVTPIATEPALSQDLQASDIILNAERQSFLARTRLDGLRLWQKHEIAIPGKYHILEEQIEIFHYLFCELQQRECFDEEIVLRWYDTLYFPAITLIGGLEILRDFPERTPGDLYIWICEHRALLRRIGSLKKLSYAVEMWTETPSFHDMRPEKSDSHQELRNFLERTRLDQLRPGAHIPVTNSQSYRILHDHIKVHRYFMGLEQKRHEIPYQEAVTHWYDVVYSPIVQVVRQQHLLDFFPDHSITDLYIWISAYQIISRRDNVSRAEEFLAGILTALPDFSYEMLDTVILTIEYLDFLLHTRLNALRPKADLSLSSPGKYRILEEHITVHRHFMGIEQRREIPYHEAVVHWYDHVYLPIVKVAIEQGVLRAFPDLSATSLYLWICEHRSKLEKQLETPVDIAVAAGDLVARFGSRKSSPFIHRQHVTSTALKTENLEQTASPSFQKEREEYALRRRESLFTNILLPFTDRQNEELALEQALKIARREDARITGLHLLSFAHQLHTGTTLKLRSFFEQRRHAAGVPGSFHTEAGELREKIETYSRQCDIIVIPSAETSTLLSTLPLIEEENSSRIPQFLSAKKVSPLQSALVLYDNNTTDNEALFAGVYLAIRWGIALTVMTSDIDAAGRTFIKEYLDVHGLEAELFQQRGPLQASLSKAMQERDCDFLIAGSHYFSYEKLSVKELQYPILLCR